MCQLRATYEGPQVWVTVRTATRSATAAEQCSKFAPCKTLLYFFLQGIGVVKPAKNISNWQYCMKRRPRPLMERVKHYPIIPSSLSAKVCPLMASKQRQTFLLWWMRPVWAYQFSLSWPCPDSLAWQYVYWLTPSTFYGEGCLHWR